MKMNILTPDEMKLMEKINKQKEKHREQQKKYYDKKRNNEEKKIENVRIKIDDLKELIKEIKCNNKIGLLKIKTDTSLRTYINQINRINNIILKKDLTKEEEDNIIQVLKNEKNKHNISYLEIDKIEETIEILRNYYKNDNTFRNILNIINILTNREIELIKKLYSYYHIKIRDKREENALEEKDKNKIIDLDRSNIIKKIENIDDIGDKLLLGLYLLIPARRLEWRKVIIKLTKPEERTNMNYMIMTNDKIEVIFNNYKTAKIYGEQVVLINDDYLKELIYAYIKKKEIKENDLLISQEGNKQKEINEGNFSTKLREVLNKVYNKDITLRFVRMSHIVYYNKENKNPKTKDRRIMAERMGHSMEEQMRYNKII
jgi:hypothetical protein